MSTIFTVVFALACLATFVCGVREQWRNARLISAATAILAFLLALLSTSVK